MKMTELLETTRKQKVTASKKVSGRVEISFMCKHTFSAKELESMDEEGLLAHLHDIWIDQIVDATTSGETAHTVEEAKEASE